MPCCCCCRCHCHQTKCLEWQSYHNCAPVIALLLINRHLGQCTSALLSGKQAVSRACGKQGCRNEGGFKHVRQQSREHTPCRHTGCSARLQRGCCAHHRIGGSSAKPAGCHGLRVHISSLQQLAVQQCSAVWPVTARTWAVEGAARGDVKHSALYRQQQRAQRVAPVVLGQLKERHVAQLARGEGEE